MNRIRKSANVAIVHEWIDAYAGSEQVFEALSKLFPAADLFALSHKPTVNLELGGRQVHTTFLDRAWLRDRRAITLPLMPAAWRALGAREYDLVISSHHAFAHSNRLAGRRGTQISYVHSPARYLWTPEIDGRGAGRLLAPMRHVLRPMDYRAAQRVARFAANSSTVAQRIKAFWNRDSIVIPPPVRVEYFRQDPREAERTYLLGVGRWIPYKNLHRVIEVANLLGLPAKIAGRGPDRSRIDAASDAARVPVEIIESPSDEELRILYHGALCLVFPTVEDFGIVPVEAQAAGVPVVAPKIGGVIDTILDKQTGELTRNAEASELAEGVTRALRNSQAEACVANSERFSLERFAERINRWTEGGAFGYHPSSNTDGPLERDS